jgi:PAS domain S-box-containing protein
LILETLLTALNDCAWAYNLTLCKYEFINPAIKSVLGLSTDELESDHELWHKIIHPDDAPMVLELTQKLSTKVWTELTYRINSNGKTKWLLEKKTLFTDPLSANEIILGVIKDITDQRSVNYYLNEAFGDFSVLFERNPNPMWIYEIPSLRILKINDAAKDIYGYNEDEFLSMTIRDIRPKIDLARFNEYIFKKGIERGTPVGYNTGGVWRHQNKNGEIIYAEITGHEINYKDTVCRIVIATNVTSIIKDKEEMDRRERFLSSLIESQTNFLIRINEQGHFTFINTSFLKKFKYSADELLDKHFNITTLPEEEHLCEETFKNCLDYPGKVFNLLHRKPDRDGNIYWTEWEFIGLANESSNLIEVQGVGQDVTGQIIIQEEIKQAAVKLDHIINSITDSFCVISYNGNFTRVNKAFEKAFDVCYKDVTGTHYQTIFKNTRDNKFEIAYNKAAQQQESIKETDFFYDLNLWLEATFYPSDEGITVFLKDITQSELAREEILMGKSNLESLINNTDDLIWSINTRFEILSMNNAFKNKVGNKFKLELEEGNDLTNAGFADEVRIEWEQLYSRALKGEKFTVQRNSNKNTPLPDLYHELSFNPIHNLEGEVIGACCFAHDITERLKAQQNIIEQNARLRNIASLSSHELRRPVATILGLTSIFDTNNFTNPTNAEIITHLRAVSEELDEVIRQIVNNTFIEGPTEVG